MPRYVSLGNLPRRRHTQFKNQEGKLYYEHLFSTFGFSGPMALMYHIHLPTEVEKIEYLGPATPTFITDDRLRHRHLKTFKMEAYGDAITGRVPLMGNSDIVWYQAYVQRQMDQNVFFKNAHGDEILFIHDSGGTLETIFGNVPFYPGDYLVVPRGTIYRMQFDRLPARMIAFETTGAVGIPHRYTNGMGQLEEHAPYHERDIRPPSELVTRNEKGEHCIYIKSHGRMSRYYYNHHPFDVVGWDGYIFPWAFSIHDFCPIIGKLHMPPPIHQTFEGKNFVICSFCPRVLDFHPEAVPIPYAHSNVDSDEVLYYCNNEFSSRKGIEEGSITLHPLGIPHGPQPGVTEASLGAKSTRELAVMMDSFNPVYLTQEALSLEDPDYWRSWQSCKVS